MYLIDHFNVGQVLVGPCPAESEAEDRAERALRTACGNRGVPVRTMHQGEVLALPGMALTALHPPDAWSSRSTVNDRSLVLRLDWLGSRLLLPGDVERTAENSLSVTDCRADVLKVPHHGSRTSSSAPFIEAVRPSQAIISTGGGRSPGSA